MRILIIFIVACISACHIAVGQRLVSLVDNIITVNTKNSPIGNTDVIEVSLPAKTLTFIYRISVFTKDQWRTTASLSALLDSMGAKSVSQTSDFRQFALSNIDKASASAFIFSNLADADNFYMNNKGWRACKNLLRITNTCMSSQQCLGKKVYFGFSNGAVLDEVDIRLEVVGLTE